jgi:hypothetical protein
MWRQRTDREKRDEKDECKEWKDRKEREGKCKRKMDVDMEELGKKDKGS